MDIQQYQEKIKSQDYPSWLFRYPLTPNPKINERILAGQTFEEIGIPLVKILNFAVPDLEIINSYDFIRFPWNTKCMRQIFFEKEPLVHKPHRQELEEIYKRNFFYYISRLSDPFFYAKYRPRMKWKKNRIEAFKSELMILSFQWIDYQWFLQIRKLEKYLTKIYKNSFCSMFFRGNEPKIQCNICPIRVTTGIVKCFYSPYYLHRSIVRWILFFSLLRNPYQYLNYLGVDAVDPWALTEKQVQWMVHKKITEIKIHFTLAMLFLGGFYLKNAYDWFPWIQCAKIPRNPYYITTFDKNKIVMVPPTIVEVQYYFSDTHDLTNVPNYILTKFKTKYHWIDQFFKPLSVKK